MAQTRRWANWQTCMLGSHLKIHIGLMMSYYYCCARFLKKAVLVHGHWNYHRLSMFINYSIYKSFAFITPQVYYAVFSLYSGATLFGSLYLTCKLIIFYSHSLGLKIPIFVGIFFTCKYRQHSHPIFVILLFKKSSVMDFWATAPLENKIL